MCCDGWKFEDEDVNGECPDCGTPTVDGHAQEGCYWSPCHCETCGNCPCDQSC